MGTTIYDYSPGAQATQTGFNTALIQATDIGTFSVAYTPKFGDAGGTTIIASIKPVWWIFY